MQNYAIDRVEIAWQGVDFKRGLATGTSFTEARTGPSFTQTMTANGEAIRTYMSDRSGAVTILVDQTSRLHQDLRELAESDRNSRTIVGPMVVKDNNSGEQLTYKNAYIATQPDEVRGTEASIFSWLFNFEGFEKTVSKVVNVVGS